MRTIAIISFALPALALAACGKPAVEEGAAPGAGAAAAESAPAEEAAPPAEEAAPADLSAARSGLYTPDPHHHHLLFNYAHQGYSVSWVRWRDWTGELNWNAEDPEASTIAVTIDARGVDSGVDEFDGHLMGESFFDAANHPTIAFTSTSLERTGPNAGKMTGDLTIKGVTKPVTLDVVLNKAGFDERANAYRLGFSAKGEVNRSDFGLDLYAPFVSNEVNLVIESEFMSPAEAN